jgi:hypothetical protein
VPLKCIKIAGFFPQFSPDGRHAGSFFPTRSAYKFRLEREEADWMVDDALSPPQSHLCVISFYQTRRLRSVAALRARKTQDSQPHAIRPRVYTLCFTFPPELVNARVHIFVKLQVNFFDSETCNTFRFGWTIAQPNMYFRCRGEQGFANAFVRLVADSDRCCRGDIY